MELKLLNFVNAAKGASAQATVTAPDTVFGRDYNEALIHQLVTAYQANARSGNRAQKGRSDIAKSTKKPWRQKGTGRARAGMASSPLWRGGGKIFPNSPDENFTQKINKKMYRAGVCSILSQLAREGRLSVVDSFAIDAPKTKLVADKLKDFGFAVTNTASTLVITDALDENMMLASRNLQGVLVVEPRHADPVSLVQYKNVIVTRSAIAKIEEMLS
jgi:large subunit ribosomal protein L4